MNEVKKCIFPSPDARPRQLQVCLINGRPADNLEIFCSDFGLGQEPRTPYRDYDMMKGVGHGRIVYTG